MSDLFVVIRGLAFCRPVDALEQTQILFPHAPEHRLSLIRSKILPDGGIHDTVTDNLPQINELNMIRDPEVTFVPPPNDANGDPPVNDLVNIGRLHRNLSRLSLKSKADVSMPISFMNLPTAKLYTGIHSSTPYEIWVHRRKEFEKPKRTFLTTPSHPQDFLAQEVMVRFIIPPPTGGVTPSITLFISGFTAPFVFQYETLPADPSIVLSHLVVFDNHCTIPQCASDFGFYYEMLNAVDNNGYSVEIEEFPLRNVFGGGSDSEASCNPVIGNTGGNCDLEAWYHGTGPNCNILP